MSAEEAAAFEARLQQSAIAAARFRAASRIGALLTLLGFLWVANDAVRSRGGWADVLIVAVSALLLGMGIVGAVLEVVVPRSRGMQLAFALGLTAAGALYAMLAGHSDLALLAIVAVMFFGAPAFAVRWRETRRNARVLPAAREDLARGEVQRFEAPSNREDAEPTVKQGIEVMPASKLLYSVGASKVTRWTIVPVVEVVTVAPEERHERRLVREVAGGPVAERRLTDDEARELNKLPRVVAMYGLRRTVLASYLAGVLLHLSDRVMGRVSDYGLRPLGWAAVGAVAAFLGARAVRAVMKARRDVAERRVLIFERSPTSREEILVNSWSRWSLGEVPAAWRRV